MNAAVPITHLLCPLHLLCSADARGQASYLLCPLPGWQGVSGLSQELGVLLQLDHLHELGQDAGAPVQTHKLGQQRLQEVGSSQLLSAQLNARAFVLAHVRTQQRLY